MSYDIVVLEDCGSCFGIFEVTSSDGKTTYRVELHGETYAHCTCPAFTYFKGKAQDRTCKHIDFVWKNACLGNAQWREAKPDPIIRPVDFTAGNFTNGICICGEKFVAVRRAV